MNGGSAPMGISMEKLVSNNYSYWKLCIEAYLPGQDLWDLYWKLCMGAYLPGQDLWDLIEGDDIEILVDIPQNVELRRQWKIKCGKTLFTLRTLIRRNILIMFVI